MIPKELSDLVLFGGSPVYAGGWPRWPRVTNMRETLAHLEAVLRTTRWTHRAPGQEPSFVERFEQAWAEHCRCKFALAVTSGSAALELALRGLGIERGVEVIVPALGWYVTAAAVCKVGATPVFADIDIRTTCVVPEEVARRVSSRTAAIIAVHLHSAVADLNSLVALANERQIPLIEDAAQSHGGEYEGSPVGSLGKVGCFSFNQEKLIPTGEGGAVVTNDPKLYRRMYALRTDGYCPPTRATQGFYSDGKVQGGNLCLSELHAALLVYQLGSFKKENEIRVSNAAALEAALTKLPEVAPLETSSGTSARPYYEFGFICRRDCFGDWTLPLLARALSAESGIDIHMTDVPVEICPQFAPLEQVCPSPRASQVYDRLLVFHHRYLLSSDIVEALPAALCKVLKAARVVPEAVVTQSLAQEGASMRMKSG